MADADDVIKEAVEASRAKDLLFRREQPTLVHAASLITQALGGSGTLYIAGEGPLALLASYVARGIHHADGNAPQRARALEDEILRETTAFVGRGDVLLALCMEGARSSAGQALEAARAKGAGTIALSGYPGDGLADRSDATIVFPSRKQSTIVEGILAATHVLERLVLRRLGLETSQRAAASAETGHKPRSSASAFESNVGSSEEQLRESSGEAVVAELVEPKKRNITSSVELVPLRAANSPGEAPANAIKFRCAACGNSVTVEAQFAGRRGQCPECLHEFTIPRAGDPSTSGSVTSAGRATPAPSSSAARRAEESAARRAGRPTPAPLGAGVPAADRRRANRVTIVDGRVAYALDVFPGESQPPVYHQLEDLSLTGLSFQVKLKGAPATPDITVGDSLFMFLDFPAYVDKVRVQGEVRRVGLLPDQLGLAVGVRFSRFLDDAQAKVRRLVENTNLRGVKRR